MKVILLSMERWLRPVETVLVAVAGACILVMMGVTFVDVLMRYALNAPIRWAFDLITLYLLPAAFFFGFAFALRRNEHVAVDFFARRMPRRLNHRLLGVGFLAAAALFAAIGWLGAVETWTAWVNAEATIGELVWLTWPNKAIIPIGMAPLVLRTLQRGAAYLVADDEPAFRDAMGIDGPIDAIPRA